MTIKRSVTISGHRTSVALEEEFWAALTGIAEQQGRTLSDLIAEIDAQRLSSNATKGTPNLSSALRVYILQARA